MNALNECEVLKCNCKLQLKEFSVGIYWLIFKTDSGNLWYVLINLATKRPVNIKLRGGEKPCEKYVILTLICLHCHQKPTLFPRFHPPNISSAITLPLETLSPNSYPLTEPIAVNVFCPGPLGISPDCYPPGTYFLCPIPPSSHPKVPPPAGTGAILRRSAAKMSSCFVVICTAGSWSSVCTANRC